MLDAETYLLDIPSLHGERVRVKKKKTCKRERREKGRRFMEKGKRTFYVLNISKRAYTIDDRLANRKRENEKKTK